MTTKVTFSNVVPFVGATAAIAGTLMGEQHAHAELPSPRGALIAPQAPAVTTPYLGTTPIR
jgi:hypothetical protein